MSLTPILTPPPFLQGAGGHGLKPMPTFSPSLFSPGTSTQTPALGEGWGTPDASGLFGPFASSSSSSTATSSSPSPSLWSYSFSQTSSYTSSDPFLASFTSTTTTTSSSSTSMGHRRDAFSAVSYSQTQEASTSVDLRGERATSVASFPGPTRMLSPLGGSPFGFSWVEMGGGGRPFS